MKITQRKKKLKEGVEKVQHTFFSQHSACWFPSANGIWAKEKGASGVDVKQEGGGEGKEWGREERKNDAMD